MSTGFQEGVENTSPSTGQQREASVRVQQHAATLQAAQQTAGVGGRQSSTGGRASAGIEGRE